jgi:hypothetical protein
LIFFFKRKFWVFLSLEEERKGTLKEKGKENIKNNEKEKKEGRWSNM